MTKCSMPECENQMVARGLCKKHWARWRRHGDANIKNIEPLPEKCDVEGCESVPHARYNGTALCNKHYLRIWKYGTTEEREIILPTWSVCCVEGCDKQTRSPGEGGMCEMHYGRVRRNGSTDIIKKEKIKKNSHDGYIRTSDISHPVSCKDGMIYEHRRILFDKIGWGPHECFWCKTSIEWTPGEKNKKGSLVVDHKDTDNTNNKIENLIPSCHKCNCLRGLFKKWAITHGATELLLMQKQSDKG